MKKLATVCLLAMLLASCATQPYRIGPNHVSSDRYSDLTCKQIKREQSNVERRLSAAIDQQKTAANTDAILTGVGLCLFWPALIAVPFGSDRESEIAQLKGELESLNGTASSKNCN